MFTLGVICGDQEKLETWDIRKGAAVQTSLMCLGPRVGHQVFNFHETLFLQERWLMLLLIHIVNLHGRVIMQNSLVLVVDFLHDQSIRLLECLLMTDHPVPSNLDPYCNL